MNQKGMNRKGPQPRRRVRHRRNSTNGQTDEKVLKESSSRHRTRSSSSVCRVDGSSQYDIFSSIGIDNIKESKLKKSKNDKK